MESTIIEKLDKSRYQLLKWQTIGWGLWFGVFILKDFSTNIIILGLLFFTGFIGWILFTVNLIRNLKLGKIVKSDQKLNDALNNELIQHNAYKSARIGFNTMLITIGISLGIASFFNVSAKLVCELILYIGVLSSQIAALIYNRD